MNPDFLWDRDEPDVEDAASEESVDLLLAQIRRMRPREKKPTLAVLGDFERFQKSVLYKTAKRTGFYRAVPFTGVSDAALARDTTGIILWSPHGEVSISEADLIRIPAGKRILNSTGPDCRKQNVEAVYERVFQRSLRVDPLTYDGLAVLKSNVNARHDGRIIRLPASKPADDSVYEQLIDNRIGERMIFDIRIPFILGAAPLAYVKLRPREMRFENVNHHVDLMSPYDVLSPRELAKCRAFCRELGLQYGELDILRDRQSGQVYVVDVNNTPAGPPKGLSTDLRAIAIRLLASAFLQNVFLWAMP